MKKIKQLALGALLALTSIGDVNAEEIKPLPSFGAQVELMVGHEKSTLDAKSFGNYEDFGVFTRNIVGTDYEGNVSDFGLVDATYNIGSGDLVLEGQYSISGDWFSPRAGIQGYTSLGNFDLYGLATMQLDNLESPALIEVLGTVNHTQDLGNVDLHSGLEVLIDSGIDGISFAQEKARVGISGDYLEGGAGVDLIQISVEDGVEVLVNAGPYVKVSF